MDYETFASGWGPMRSYYESTGQLRDAYNSAQSVQGMGGNPWNLQGGNSMGALMGATNAAAGRQLQTAPTGQAPSAPTQAAGPSFAVGGQPVAQPPAQPQAGAQTPTQNPYMQQMFDSITGQVNSNLQRKVLPQIDRNAVASGNYGSSRHGIAQGLAIGDASRAATDAMANYGFQQFNNDRNYGLQSDALDLNAFNANQNWANVGAGQQLNTLQTLLGLNQQYGIGNATNVQNTPLNYWQQFAGTGATLGGLGGTNSQTLQGNQLLSALGGALAGGQLWKSFGQNQTQGG